MPTFPSYRQSIPAPGERQTVWPETGEVITVDEYNRRQAEAGPVLQDWIADDVDPDSLTDTAHGQVPQWLRYEREVGALPSPVVDRPPPVPGSKYEAFLRGQQPPPRQVRPAPARRPGPRPQGNADLDNLSGAAAPIVMEPELGNNLGKDKAPLTRTEARVRAGNAAWRDSLEPGSDLQQRFAPESYEAWMDENVRQPIGENAKKWVGTYGDSRTPEAAAAMTPEQRQARSDLRDREAAARHTPIAEEQRIRRMADKAGISYAEAADMVNRGYARAAAARQQHPDSAWVAGGQNDSTPPSFEEFGEAYAELRQKAGDAAAAQRREQEANARRILSQRAMLRSDPIGYLGRSDITDAQREAVQGQLPGAAMAGRSARVESENAAKIRVAEINAQATRDAAAAERESRVSQEQWRTKTQMDYEERQAARQREDEQKKREFEAEQKQLDRDAKKGADQAVIAERQAALDRDRQQHEEMMKRMDAQDAEAARRHAASMAQSAAEAAERRVQMEGTFGLQKSEEEEKKRQREEAVALSETKARLDPLVATHGAGVVNISQGDYDTPAAQEALDSIAAGADQSWSGFYNSDAVRMDAILRRIGVGDPAVRQALVQKHGLGTMAASGPGGRSGVISGLFNWLSGPPTYKP